MDISRRTLITQALATSTLGAMVLPHWGESSASPPASSPQSPVVRPSPGSATHPWQMDAGEALSALNSGALSSRELVESCIARINAVNPTLLALNHVDVADALRAASACDAHRRRGKAAGVLCGLPIATKDNTDVAGQPMTNGVVALRDNIAQTDAPQIAMLRRSGAVFLGRSNTPCFSFSWDARNDLHGTTLNPWSAAHTPGGSSGGAACAVAAGMVPLAHGNDVGGSIRHPAFCCGVVGLRPTPGRVPSVFSPAAGADTLSLQQMLVDGPIARSVADLGVMLAGMQGFHPRSPLSLPVSPDVRQKKAPFRIGVVLDDGIAPRTAAVSDALQQAARALNDAGYSVEPVVVPQFGEAWRLWWLLVLEETRALRPIIERDGDEAIQRWIDFNYRVAAEMWGARPSLDVYMGGYQRRGQLIAQLQVLMEQYPVILLPVTNEGPFTLGQHYRDLDSARAAIASAWSMMAIPVLGFPALSVPTGRIEGVPMGVQLLGRRFDEATLLAVGSALEARMPKLGFPPMA